MVLQGDRVTVDNSFIFADTLGDIDGAELGIDIHATDEFVHRGLAHLEIGLITADSFGAGKAGAIHITAGRVQMENAFLASRAFADGRAGDIVVTASTVAVAGGAQIDSSTFGPGHGGNVTVRATEAVTLAGSRPDGFPSGVFANTRGTGAGAGNAGTVLIEAPTVTLTAGGQLVSETFGPGHGGNVTIMATEAVTLAGIAADGIFPGGIFANALGTEDGAGNAGSVAVQAKTVTLTGGGQINNNTFGPGHGGNVTITATEAVTLADSSVFANTRGTGAGAGNAGTVVIEAPTVTLTAGGQLVSETFGPGQGGTVTVTATDAITLAGTNLDGTRPSGLFAGAQGPNAGAGNAGSLVVQAPRVTLTGGAQISSTTFGPGQGGTATVTATDVLTIAGTNLDSTRPSGIFAGAQGPNAGAGNAGSLVVQAPRVALTEGARISSSTLGPGQGGTVTVTAMDSITLAGQDSFGNASGLFANTMGSGDAGHVAVVTPTLTMDGGNIQAVSFNSGNAGNITLEVGRLTLTGGAQLGSNSLDTGHGGTITVTATDAVSLAANAEIDASGAGGGTVVIRSGHLLVDQSTIAANTRGAAHSAGLGIDLDVRDSIVLTQNAVIIAASSGAGDAGAIRIAAHSLRGTDNAFIGAGALEDGNAGDIRIDVGTLTLANRAVIDSRTLGNGAAGHVTVIAPTLELPGGRIRASTEGAGNAGAIAVEAAHVSLTEGGQNPQ